MRLGLWLRMAAGGAMISLLAVVLWVAYSGRGGQVYSFLTKIPGGDKTGHVALVAVLSFGLSWVLAFRAFRVGFFPVFWGAFAVLVFITIEEFAQAFSPYRTFDLGDLASNYLGGALATLLCLGVKLRGSVNKSL